MFACTLCCNDFFKKNENEDWFTTKYSDYAYMNIDGDNFQLIPEAERKADDWMAKLLNTSGTEIGKSNEEFDLMKVGEIFKTEN